MATSFLTGTFSRTASPVSPDILAHKTVRLTPSAKKILSILDDGRSKTFHDISSETAISERAIRNALSLLRKEHLIIAKFNIRDGRQVLYEKMRVS